MPLTVLHLNTEMGWRGGEAQTLFLAAGLERRGVRSLVVAPPRSALAARAAGAGLQVRPLTMHGEWDLAAAWRLAGLVRRERVDVLHYHTAHATAIGALARLRTGRRRTVAARRVSFPLRHVVLSRLKYNLGADRVIAVSEAIRRSLIAQGLCADRVVTIHSGIDPHRFQGGDRARFRAATSAPPLTWPPDAFLVGTVGHLAAHKGFDLFLEAAAAAARDLPSARFVVAGEGEEERELRRRADAIGLGNRVWFAGFRDDMPDVLAGLDLFVLASRGGEGSPAVLKEAMAAGVAVVATALDGVEEIIEDAAHGVLTPPGDAPALARAIVRLAADGALRARLVSEARRRADDFTIDRMVDRTREVYATLGGTA
jgi:glycosyltransferase involved in cell wall biosynthesis